MSEQASAGNKLDELNDLRSRLVLLSLDESDELAVACAPVQAHIDAIRSRFAPKLLSIQAEIESLEAEIKQDVLAHGDTLKACACGLSAIYVRGRVSWDTKRLDRYAVKNPDVLEFRSEGEPSVRIVTGGAK